MGHISHRAEENCYAVMWSCGEICVGSNCCGQFQKGLPMWEARLKYDTDMLNEKLNFNNWIEGFEKLQKENIKSDIKYYRRMIRKNKYMIKYYKNK